MAEYATRSANERDLPRIAAIYNHAVEHSLATFDLEPPDTDYWRARLDGEHPGDHLLVAVDAHDHAVGYAYSWSFRPRPAYALTRETSIYLDGSVRGRGVGRMLYPALLQTMAVSGVHTAIAAVALPNPASERLHVACGFAKVGEFKEVGNKFDHWVDMAFYQRMLVNIPTGDAVLD
ncbi:N-acetyltransferase [Nocardioides sp. ChNu-153]|uniref:GNAT family N-acetyltransferase n=1 Tax=unclassified Nocardioides TaxID=2615069 RepID=UPI00240636D5|nr:MULTISPECIES: GNAT family N-acetyltransferase [unclassified Nocardioides]MDF9715311.1 GNAT family N-acetyltransferase [Nocardioides sp. ChNu-99]MDN7121718.1 N-acetyltransferase [Nocardioides sp. ChNu-153]